MGGLTLPSHLPAIEALWSEASEPVLLADDAQADGQQQRDQRGLSREAFSRIVRRLKMEVLLPHHRPRPRAQSVASVASVAASAQGHAGFSALSLLRMSRSVSTAAAVTPEVGDDYVCMRVVLIYVQSVWSIGRGV
jgi:hypothetical protein